VPAEVLDLEEDYALLVRLPDGSTQRLNSGEVSVRVDDKH
jgi:biotin-(acetyl-CoA carboxylase) ligase